MSDPLSFVHPPTSGAVSVIVIAQNAARFLAQALESVRRQRLRPTEVLLVLGRSSDDTDAVAERFAEVVRIRQPGQGIADAWNTGIVHSRGEFLAFLSADDLWTEDKLEVQLGRMFAEPELAYTVAHFRYLLEPGHPWPRGLRPELADRTLIGRIMETLIARREVFARLGGFDCSLSTAEDVDFFLRAQEQQLAMAVLPEVLLHKRLHDSNASLVAATNTKNLLLTLHRSISRRAQLREPNC